MKEGNGHGLCQDLAYVISLHSHKLGVLAPLLYIGRNSLREGKERALQSF